MDHAEAHERIADLALDPAALDRLADRLPDDQPFLDHVAGCPACTSDLAAARSLRAELRVAFDEAADATALDPIAPPDWLRAAVLDGARREPRGMLAGVPGRAVGSWLRRWTWPRLSAPQWAAGIAAVLVIAVLGGVVGSTLGRPAGGGDQGSLAAAMTTLDRVLAGPDHRVAQLHTSAGAAAGSVAWSASDFAVLTSSLSVPTDGRAYTCWLGWAGTWTKVGVMDFAGGTAYWTGPVGDWGATAADPGTRFVVTLEPAGPAGEYPTGPVVLQATLGT